MTSEHRQQDGDGSRASQRGVDDIRHRADVGDRQLRIDGVDGGSDARGSDIGSNSVRTTNVISPIDSCGSGMYTARRVSASSEENFTSPTTPTISTFMPLGAANRRPAAACRADPHPDSVV